MKGFLLIMASVLMALMPVSSCKGNSRGEDDNSKVLVAYFSVTGNTKAVAEHIAYVTGGDVWRIELALPYSQSDLDYTTAESRSNREQHDSKARPQMFRDTPKLDHYSVIFVGYPIWWGIAPRIIESFLEGGKFKGKTVIPFCTSASSPLGESGELLHKSAPDADWKPGHRFAPGAGREEVAEWVNEVLGRK